MSDPENAPMEQTNPQINATLEVVIERILPGGLGLAHAQGRTYW